MRSLLTSLALLSLLPAVFAQDLRGERAASLTAYRYEEGPATGLGVHLRGASGQLFEWQVRATPTRPGDPGPWTSLGFHALDERGEGHARTPLPQGAAARLQQRARFLQGTTLVATPVTSTEEPLEEPLGELFDCDWGLGGVALPAGLVVSDTQPWGEFVQFTAENANPAHPDAALLVDSTRWADALAPPGGGGAPVTGSWTAGDDWGQVLTIAADLTDADGDGLVDDPTSEAAGGVLTLQFAGPSRPASITLFDIDEDGGEVRAYFGDRLLGSKPIPNEGDLSIQTLYLGDRRSKVTGPQYPRGPIEAKRARSRASQGAKGTP